MNHRERFLNTMHFSSVDRPVFHPIPIGVWNETILRWKGEGLPDDVTQSNCALFFNSDPRIDTGIYFGMCPSFEKVILEEDDDTVTYRNFEGIMMREFKYNAELSMPQFLDFPVKDQRDFTAILSRLQVNESERFPGDWMRRCKDWEDRQVPLSVNADREGGFYGPLRNLMGLEGLSMTYYDDPSLIDRMIENRVELMIGILDKILKDTTIDWFIFWEDMCYNHASLLSPALFKKYMVPAYRKVTNFLRKKGVDTIFVDSDGKIDDLIPLWLEGGVNGIYPMEVQSGSDVVAYRKKYGKDLLMMGGVDKKALVRGKADILSEIRRVMPIVEQGGYIPGIDHSVPPDVSLDSFTRSEERRVGKECRSRWSPYH